jgi:hypothetical protein
MTTAPAETASDTAAATPHLWTGRLVSGTAATAAVVFGEAAVVALCAVSRRLAGGVGAGVEAGIVAWAVATALVALVGYGLVGLPQIKAWAHDPHASHASEQHPSRQAAASSDPRARLAARTLSTGGAAAFVAAAVIGGPLAVGWFYGRRRDPRARSLTWTAAWAFGAAWSAVYLGLLASLAR